MAVKLRLTRRGKKKQPTYRVVAADSRFPRDGRFIEILGFYDPRPEPSEIRIDSEKTLKWLRNGAQPSDRVKKLLEITGVWAEFSGKASKITLAESAKAPANLAASDTETSESTETPDSNLAATAKSESTENANDSQAVDEPEAETAEDIAEPTAEDAVEASAEDTTEDTAEPSAEPTAGDTTEATTEDTTEATAEPSAEATAEDTTEPTTETEESKESEDDK